MAIIAATITLVSVYCIIVFTNIRALERERQGFSEAEARKILLSFEMHSVRLLDFADTYLRAARHFYQTESIDDLPYFLDEVAPPRADIFTSALAILDAQGRMVFSSDRSAPRNADLSDQAAFAHFQQQPTDHLFIGAANISTVADHQYFHLARPVMTGKAVGGLIILTIHSSQIAAFYRDMTLGPNSSAAMFTQDKQLIARQPPPVAEAAPMGTLRIWTDSEAKPEGKFHKRSQLDGIERTFLYRRLTDYPLIVVIGFADSDISHELEAARHSSIFEAALFVVTALAFCALLLVMEKRNRRLVEAEWASRAAAEKLERSNADLERFAYVASHDLKTPLRVITGYAQMLDRRYRDKLDDEANEYISFLTAGTKRMYRLITDLLHYSRVNSQAKALQPVGSRRPLDIALSNLKAVIEETGAEITIGRTPNILADEGQLSSLFQNLLGNAIKYRHPDRKPEISVDAVRADSRTWRFSVQDNGIGIEAEHFERIFVIFQRLHAETSYEGTGIGLALCQRIVTRMGGRIWVESTPGEGSTFFFTASDAASD